MQRSKHLVHPRQSANGVVHRVTPKSAGWTYVGFEARDLKAGKRVSIDSGATETCVVVLSGKARVRSKGFDSGTIGARAHVFEAPPWSVYLPAGSAYSIKAVTDCEVAICTAPGKPGRAARVIAPDEVETLTRGKGSNTRYIRNVLPESAPADSLLVVEAITPGGHWSSYPPHKHDRDAIPENPISKRPITTASRRRRASPCSGSTRRTAPSTRRWRSATATWCWCRAATTRSARRTATTSTIST